METAALDAVWQTLNRIATSDYVLMTLVMVPPLFLVEWLWRAHRETWAHYRFGIAFFAVNAVVLGVIAPTINYYTAKGIQAFGYGLIDLSALGLGGIGGSVLAVLVSTFILDFFYYWFHRAFHGSRFLWQMHLLHHSDENMNMLTAQRGHFLEGMFAPLFITIPMAVLFRLPAIEIAILSLVPQMYQFLAHANIRLGYGPLWWLIISPDYHRIHHSIEPRHRDRNFTNWFPIWDILFGTVYVPQRGERPATGVAGVEVKTVAAAYLLPLRGWMKMYRKARGQQRPAPRRLQGP